MDINELLERGENLTISIKLNDLMEFADYIIEQTKKELGEIVLSDKAETYPTVKQVQDILNVDPSTLWRWNKNGYLKTFEFGGGRRYKMSEVKAILNPPERRNSL